MLVFLKNQNTAVAHKFPTEGNQIFFIHLHEDSST